jgi:hypothetical protein
LPPSTASARRRFTIDLLCRAARQGELLDELVDELDLADQRVGEEGLPHIQRVAGDRRACRQPLVGSDVLREPEQLRRQRRLRQGYRATGSDLGRDFDDVVLREPGDRVAVPDVDHLDVAGVAGEGRHEADGRLAVEGASAPLEQLPASRPPRDPGRGRGGRFDLRDGLGAWNACSLCLQNLVVGVEVAEVVGRNGSELVQDTSRQATRHLRELVTVAREELGQHVVSVDPGCPHPRQVVEPDLVDENACGVDVEHVRKGPLEPDRDIAQADRAVAGVEERSRDDSDRIGEVDDPGVRRGVVSDGRGDVEHHGHRSHRLGEAPGTRRLLADASARERCGLVA